MQEAFADRLIRAVEGVGNAALVGLDPDPSRMPPAFLQSFPADRAGLAAALRTFSRAILEAVAELVPAVKFQAAYYEAYGPEGLAALFDGLEHARRLGLIAILDGKRNDIGSTAGAYALGYLGQIPMIDHDEGVWNADALTVNPYLGSDGVAPFVEVAAREGRGVFVLVRTSNPSSSEFQGLRIEDGRPLYRHVADRLVQWGEAHLGLRGYSSVGAVVGATFPAELAELRAALPRRILLIPGYGSQGGSARDVAAGFDDRGLGALVNSSRGILYAYQRPEYRDRFRSDWQAAAAQATRDMIADLAAHTPMGRLPSG